MTHPGLRSYGCKTKSFSSSCSLITAKSNCRFLCSTRQVSTEKFDSTVELLIEAQGPLFISKRAAFLGDRKTQITCIQVHLHTCAGT